MLFNVAREEKDFDPSVLSSKQYQCGGIFNVCICVNTKQSHRLLTVWRLKTFIDGRSKDAIETSKVFTFKCEYSKDVIGKNKTSERGSKNAHNVILKS